MSNKMPTIVSATLVLGSVAGLFTCIIGLALTSISLPFAGMSILIFTGVLAYAILNS
jgi:hypothetical protein